MLFNHSSTTIDHQQQAIWRQAALSTDQADPFCCTPEWQLSFHQAFCPEQPLLLSCANQSILAFAEHSSAEETTILAPIEAHWLFGSPLLGPYAVELLAEQLAGLEKHYKTTFPKIVISGIRPGSNLPQQLFKVLGNYFDFYLHSSGVQGAASLHHGLDGFLSRRSANHRRKLKKQTRKAKERDIYFERICPTSADQASQIYARMIAVELKSWKGIGKCGMAEPPAREFYHVLLQQLAKKGSGHVIFARHEEMDIGFIFGGLAGQIYRGQQFSYDQAWQEYSIGNLLQVEEVKWLCQQGARRYDLGPVSGPKMAYKKHWAELNFTMENWLLIRKCDYQPNSVRVK